MSDSTSQGQNRSALYVDGYNLYHPINDMQEPFLKWANLWKLGEIFSAPEGLQLVRVAICTALPIDSQERKDRHNKFLAAQRAHNVVVYPGHYMTEPGTQKRTEKQSDVNLALALMFDGLDDVYDTAYLLTADSDQAATGKFFSERLPGKRLISVAPPGRKPPEKLVPYTANNFTMTKYQLECCVMPEMVPGLTGHPINRPADYAPPAWWVHPDARPKKSKA